ncbi:kynurenine formamidase-like [Ptychodera flava]|uniref:kynurenine formamidase-like n=1 Tax=Ptychodera flava TaxID=63121 RepID=UPI003969BF8F
MEVNREDLDFAYSPSRWSKRLPADKIAEDHLQVGKEAFEKAKLQFDHELDVVYTEDNVCLNLFHPKTVMPDAPVLIYIHGGYWQLVCEGDGAHLALGLQNNGIIVVCPKYTIAPKGTMQQMVNEIRQAVVFVAKRYPKTRGIFLSGHSAGGHLAAMCLPVDWTAFGLKQDIIKGMLLFSGVFDVTPLVHTYVNKPLKMTEAEAKAVSPVKYIKESCQLSKHCKIIAAVGEHDPPAFLQQSEDYCQQLENGGMSVKYVVVPGKDHFDIVHSMSLGNKNMMTQELLKLISMCAMARPSDEVTQG